MKEILAQLSQYPVSTRLSLTGTIIVGRDIAHAKLKELITPVKNFRSTSKITRSTSGSGENPCRLSIRFTWPNHRRPYGLLRGSAAIPRRQHDHAGER
ncbi:fumarate hydratase C-terminal domain-containing protein [Escherichia coli]